jgi:hypothetical protein
MALKLKIRSIFPALVSAESPLTLIKNGLSYVFGLDLNALRSSLGNVASGPATSTLGNIAFFDTTSGDSIGSAPSYQAGNPARSALYSVTSDPPTGYSGFYNGLQISQGGTFPASQQYLGEAVPVRQAVVGTSVIPSTDTTTWQAVGIAGYARGDVAGAGRNLVGAFGQATTTVANSNLFGANFLAVNNDGSLSTVGYDANYISGIEVNINLWKKSGGLDPTIAGGHVYGITIAGSGNVAAQISGSAGIVINQMSVGSNIPWNHAFLTYDGAAVNGVTLGATSTATNSVESQNLLFTARNAGGVAKSAKLNADINGSLQIIPGLATVLFDSSVSATLVVQGGVGNTGVQLAKLAAAGVLTNDNTGAVTSAATLSRTLGGTQSTTGAVVKVAVQKFTSSGTYTPSAGLLYATIECVGGGGSGGSVTAVAANFTTGSGGAGGTYSKKTVSAATVGASQVVTVGAGGAAPATGDNSGNAGGTTSVGALCTAPGGGGGPFAHAGVGVNGGGIPGAAGTGDLSVPGSAGGGGLGAGSAIGLFCGFGGSSHFGGITAVPAVNSNGGTGQNYGAGGSGAQDSTGTTNRAGGAGGIGVVIITEYLNQ